MVGASCKLTHVTRSILQMCCGSEKEESPAPEGQKKIREEDVGARRAHAQTPPAPKARRKPSEDVAKKETHAQAKKAKADSAVVPQTKLRELLASNPDIKKTKFVKNVPIAVYPLNAESLASMPSLILIGMGELDKATYPNKDAYLKANFGGTMALQVAHGKLDAYPIPADQYTSKYKAVSIEEMQTKNPKNATALSGILGDLSSIPGVCGALKTVPTEMVLASDLGFSLKNLLKIEAPWGGDQTKDAGKDAYLVVCDAPYLINLDELGLPVAYIMASDAQEARKRKAGAIEKVTDQGEYSMSGGISEKLNASTRSIVKVTDQGEYHGLSGRIVEMNNSATPYRVLLETGQKVWFRAMALQQKF